MGKETNVQRRRAPLPGKPNTTAEGTETIGFRVVVRSQSPRFKMWSWPLTESREAGVGCEDLGERQHRGHTRPRLPPAQPPVWFALFGVRSTVGCTCAGMSHREGSVMREWPREWDPGCQVSGTGVGAGDAGTVLSEIPQGISCKMGGWGGSLGGSKVVRTGMSLGEDGGCMGADGWGLE